MAERPFYVPATHPTSIRRSGSRRRPRTGTAHFAGRTRRKGSDVIIRFYRATVHDGRHDAFERFLLETALPTVRSYDGLVSASVGLPHESVPGEFSMVTIWRDLASLKGFTGEDWQNAVVHPDEADLLKETYVHHCHAEEA